MGAMGNFMAGEGDQCVVQTCQEARAYLRVLLERGKKMNHTGKRDKEKQIHRKVTGKKRESEAQRNERGESRNSSKRTKSLKERRGREFK